MYPLSLYHHPSQAAEARAAALCAGEEEGEEAGGEQPDVMPFLAGGKWSCAAKDYLAQRGEASPLHQHPPAARAPAAHMLTPPTLPSACSTHAAHAHKASPPSPPACMQAGARISCAAYHPGNSLLVAGLTSGLFDIYQLPGWENIQVRV